MPSCAPQSKAFTLVELLASIAIIAIIVGLSMPFVGNYVAYANATAARQTLAVLNDALTRYKTQGGTLSNLTQATTVGGVLSKLTTPLVWNGVTHQVVNSQLVGAINPADLVARGDGKTYRYISYRATTLEGVNVPLTTSNSRTDTLSIPLTDSTNMCIDANGKLWATGGANTWKIDPIAGTKTGYSANEMFYLGPITAASDGYLYAIKGNQIVKINPNATTPTATFFAGSGVAGDTDANGLAAEFRSPSIITADHAGNIYIGDYSYKRIRRLTTAGDVTTLVPYDTVANANWCGITFSATGGGLIISDCNWCRLYFYNLSNNSFTEILPGQAGCATAGICADPTRDRIYLPGWSGTSNSCVYYTDHTGSAKTLLAGSATAGNADGANTQATFDGVRSMVVDAQSNLYILQSVGWGGASPGIRKITPQ